MSAIFYANEEQKKIALETQAKHEATHGKTLTVIEPAARFYAAEDYHQKYYLKRWEFLMAEFTTMYPKPADFIRSTAVARVNSYISGHGNIDDLKREIDSYGLSDSSKAKLLSMVEGNH